MMHGGSLPDALSAYATELPWRPLSACLEGGDGRCYGQWATLKGFEGQRLIRWGFNVIVCLCQNNIVSKQVSIQCNMKCIVASLC